MRRSSVCCGPVPCLASLQPGASPGDLWPPGAVEREVLHGWGVLTVSGDGVLMLFTAVICLEGVTPAQGFPKLRSDSWGSYSENPHPGFTQGGPDV